jgi:hypothetical protein
MKSNKVFPVIVLLLFVVSIVFISGNLPFSIVPPGSTESDLLITNMSATFLQSQTSPIAGDVIQVNGVVGLKNDTAIIGSLDKDSGTVSGNGRTVNYYLLAKKQAMSTSIAVTGTNYSLRQPSTFNTGWDISGTQSGASIGTLWDDAQEKASLKQAGVSAVAVCKSTLGTSYFGTDWRPISGSSEGADAGTHSDCTGIPTVGNICAGGNWIPKVQFYCFALNKNPGYTTLEYKSFGNKTINAEVQVQVMNAQSAESSVVTLTPQNPTQFLTSGGATVAQATLTGWQPNFQLPVDLTNEVPVRDQAGVWKIGNRDYLNTSYTTAQTASNYVATDWQGTGSTVQTLFNTYKTNYNNAYANRKSYFLNDTSHVFTYKAATSSFDINDVAVQNGTISVVISGQWAGLIREEANFSLSCGNPVSGYVGETKTTTATVSNTSAVSGTGTLSWSCASGSGNRTLTVAGGANKIENISLNIQAVGSNTCGVTFNYPLGSKTCNLNYTGIARPVDCGNGVVNPGETCVSCPQDIVCSSQQFCNTVSQVCEAKPVTCPNNLVDAGETCNSCPQDLETVNGIGYCSGNAGPDWFLVGGILVGLVIVGGIAFVVLGKKRKRRR